MSAGALVFAPDATTCWSCGAVYLDADVSGCVRTANAECAYAREQHTHVRCPKCGECGVRPGSAPPRLDEEALADALVDLCLADICMNREAYGLTPGDLASIGLSHVAGLNGRAEDELARETPNAGVYFVQGERGGPIKIGVASDVEARVSALQVSHHEKLVVRLVVAGDAARERAFHRQFRKHRIRGEWFAPDPELLKFIEREATKP